MSAKSRQADDQKKRAAAALQKELLYKLPPSHPLRKDAEERGAI